MVKLYSANTFADKDVAIAEYLFKKHKFRELVKLYHPDVNNGNAEKAFKRLAELRRLDQAVSSKIKANELPLHEPTKIINKLSVDNLLADSIVLSTQAECICDKCKGLGYTSKDRIVKICNKCGGSGIYSKSHEYILSTNGEFIKGVHTSIEDGLMLVHYKNFCAYVQITDAIVLPNEGKTAILVYAKDTNVHVNGKIYSIKKNNIVEIDANSAPFSLYAVV